MRRTLPCTLPLLGTLRYVPRHAAPREPLTGAGRSAVAVGLTAALLPLSAGPALADGDPAVPSAPADAAALPTTAAAAPVEAPPVAAAPEAAVGAVPEAAVPAAAEAPPAAAPQPPASPPPAADRALPSGAAAPKAAAPAAPPPGTLTRKAVGRAATDLRLLLPGGTVAPGRVPVSVRLRADGAPVRNGLVRLERATPTGWAYAGRVLTGPTGVGKSALRLSASTRVRAAYSGSAVRTPDATSAYSVQVRSRATVRVLEVASRYAGRPYRYGATGPSSFDCSGFTRYVYAQLGVRLPHNSGAQARVSRRVSKASARPGDLVFLGGGRIGHVGIYAGGGKMWDAPRAGKRVSLRTIYSSDYIVGRVL